MKVELLRRSHRGEFRSAHFLAPLPVTRSVPFYASRIGTRMHRVRAGEFLRSVIDPPRLCVELWCGQGGSQRHGSLFAEPLEGWPICGTCEGRAVGAGQLGSSSLVASPLIFTPTRGDGLRCGWEYQPRDPWGPRPPRACGKMAKATAELVVEGGADTARVTCRLDVCRDHRSTAIRKGWTVTDWQGAERARFPDGAPPVEVPPPARPIEVPVIRRKAKSS